MEKMGPFEEANEAAGAAMVTPVTESSWGLFACSAFPEPGLAARGEFLWFNTREELLTFLERHCVYWVSLGAGETEDLERISAEARTLIGQIRAGERAIADAMEQLSDWLYEFNREIAWAGSMKELWTGTGEFPSGLRAWFRSLQNGELRNEDRPEDLIPLKKEEQDDFMDVVALYSEIDEED